MAGPKHTGHQNASRHGELCIRTLDASITVTTKTTWAFNNEQLIQILKSTVTH